MAIKYAQIIDLQKKTCAVATNEDNIEFYIKLGFIPLDVEHCDWDGNWYLAGFCPVKPEPTKEEKIQKLKCELADVDEKSNRSMRAILAGTSTEEDRNFLASLESQAAELRRKIQELEEEGQ